MKNCFGTFATKVNFVVLFMRKATRFVFDYLSYVEQTLFKCHFYSVINKISLVL